MASCKRHLAATARMVELKGGPDALGWKILRLFAESRILDNVQAFFSPFPPVSANL
jgi:hypothetical protein